MKIFFFLLFCSNLGLSQVGIGTTTPNSSSMLEVKSAERGFLAPRMNYNQIIAIENPAQGMMVFCTECSPMGYVFYNGTSWVTAMGNALTVIPNRPTNVYATAGGNSSSVSFDVPSIVGTSPISYYIVKTTIGNYTATGFSSPIEINGLSNFLSYSFTVTAVALDGTTETSDISNTISPLIGNENNKITYNYILSTGQSLSVGANSTAISLVQPYDNLSLSSGPQGTSLPLLRIVEFSVETPSSGMANTLRQLDNLHRPIIIGLHGLGGAAYTTIKKGSVSYNKGINQFNDAKNFIESNNGFFKPIGLTVVHGEGDFSTGTYATYENNLYQWLSDYRTDTNSPTLKMFISQMNSAYTGKISDAQLNAHIDYPNNIILIGPKYQYNYNDGIHLNSLHYKHSGEMLAKVIDKVIFKNQIWNPLMPTTINRNSNIITLSFNIPVGTLVLDTNLVALRSNYGFEFVQTGGSVISISNVELINNNTQVKITLSGTPDGADQRVRYAWKCPIGAYNVTCGGANDSNKVGGNLRDSDSSISTAIGSSELPLYNWCVAFDKPIN